jgi:ABC-type sugar transport system ATPase subunit
MLVQTDYKSGKIALSMTGISKVFWPVKALDNVSFSVRAGTVHALVGENGAGKSTLMKILAGACQPDSGSIEIDGVCRTFLNPHQALGCGVAMIYQELDLAEHLTVAANVFLGIEPHGAIPFAIDHKAMAERTGELAKHFGFDIAPDATVSELATGDCQITELLKALVRNAFIIVMDEPTSSLSESEARKLFEVVRMLRQKGISIIYISHRLEEIVDIADDITVLRDGKTVHSGSAAGLDISHIVHYMVGRELKELFPARTSGVGEVCVRVDSLSSDTVNEVSFDIRSGEIVGMAGLVGAGRTEVAKAIFGIDKKSGGDIMLDGKRLIISTPADAIAAGIAFLTEDRKRTGLCLHLPCSWNITLAVMNAVTNKNFINPAKESRVARDFASSLSIKWHSPNSPADSLSGGNQQKLLIARWLLANAKFLIFDEPTRGIDVGAKREIYLLLNRLAEEGKAVLFISSELPELLGLTHRILIMRRGRLAADLCTAATTQEQIMHLAAIEENK